MSRACSASSPNPTTTRPKTGEKCRSSGTNGSGGALSPAMNTPQASGRVSTKSRANRNISLPWSGRNRNSPSWRMGPTGWSWNSNSVTTPKLPPPPRMAQSRSGLSVSEACSTVPSAVTTSAPTRLSADSPASRDSQPNPPPRVETGDPGPADEAAGDGQAVLLGGGVELAPGRPAAACGPAGVGVDAHRLHRRQVDHQTVFAQGEAGVVVTAAAHRHLEPLLSGEGQGGGNVGAGGAAGHHRRPATDGGVPDVDRLVVAGLAGSGDGPAQTRLQFVNRTINDVRHDRSS